jgi:aminopeptidase N
MRSILLAAVLAAMPAALRAAEAYPQGKLPDAAKPVAYRVDLTVEPAKERFSGHVEIDVELKAATSSLYLHGRGLKVAKAVAKVGAVTIDAKYAEVDQLGVARIDFDKPLPAGKATLVFDYDAPFGSSASGLYHVEVGGQWYAWTQFESIDARAAFPSFDEPGFKTPFTVSLTTKPGFTTVSNAPETGSEKVGELVRHRFEATRPLPTYLVAFMVGPFAVAEGSAAPTPERATPLPVRVVATQPNKDKMAYGLENTGPIVGLLEKYFGRAFPFPKLDQIASPVMQGAMENAGADTYGDSIILLEKNAPTWQKRGFGMVVAHELAHQWFGDLVSPAWWDDIWLNESFANWMGYRIGNEWQPDLKIGVGAINEAFTAMNTDALKAGRPIHQPILTNGEIDSAFDAVTYGKGGQVVAMIAAYLGDEKFRDGVRLHLNRYAYGNASTEQFFASLAEGAHDPRVLASLKSFVDLQGVPVVRIERKGEVLTVAQKRYALYGTVVAPQSWTIPLCVRVGQTRKCELVDKTEALMPGFPATGAIMPNAGGTGYYRFSMREPEWRTLIDEAATLEPGEALALTDSLWGAFRAGEVSPGLLVDAAVAMAANPYSGAAIDGASRLGGLRVRGMIPDASLPAYRALIARVFAPKLKAMGLDPKAGAYAGEDPDRQQLRTNIVGLLLGEAHDKAIQTKLAGAAKAYLGGNKAALDPALLDNALGAYLATGGTPAVKALYEKAVASEDPLFRDAGIGALGDTGDATTGRWLIAQLGDKRLRNNDRLDLLRMMTVEPATRDMAFDWIKANYDKLVKDSGIFVASSLPNMPSRFCSVEKAAEIEATIRPKVDAYKRGALALDRSVEQVRSCGLLLKARGADLAGMFSGK